MSASTVFPYLAAAIPTIAVGDMRSFQAMAAVHDWPEKPYQFYPIRNDDEAFIVERQYAPGKWIDVTRYRASEGK